MRGPGRGHVKTPQHCVGRKCHNFTIMTTHRKSNCTTKMSQYPQSKQKHSESQVDCILSNELRSNCRKSSKPRGKDKKQLVVCSLSIRKTQATSVRISVTAGDTEGLPRQCPLCRRLQSTIDANHRHPSTPPFGATFDANHRSHPSTPSIDATNRRHQPVHMLTTHQLPLHFGSLPQTKSVKPSTPSSF